MTLCCENSVAIKNPANVLTMTLKNNGTINVASALKSLIPTYSNGEFVITHQSVTIKKCMNVLITIMKSDNVQNVLLRFNLNISARSKLLIESTTNHFCKIRL